MGNFYEEYAQEFVRQMELDDEEAQLQVVEEEVEELATAVREGEGDVGEELADVLITAFVFAEIEDVYTAREYREKMKYNMQKSPEKDESGKVTDDVE